MRKQGIRWCVCVDCYSCSRIKDQYSASKSFYRLLAMFSWILISGFAKLIMLGSRVFCFAIAAFSEEYVEKLV